MTPSWSCDRRVCEAARRCARTIVCVCVRPSAWRVRWIVRGSSAGWESRVFLQPYRREATSPEMRTAPPAPKRRRGGSDGILYGSRYALDRGSSYPLIMRGWLALLGFRSVITGRASERGTRTSHIRDPDSRATETRVRPVPAVARRGRCVSVADDTAERPVQACTRRGAARTMRGRPLPDSAMGRITSSTMTSHGRGLQTTSRAADTPGESQDSPAADRNDICGGCNEHRDATTCMKDRHNASRVNSRNARGSPISRSRRLASSCRTLTRDR